VLKNLSRHAAGLTLAALVLFASFQVLAFKQGLRILEPRERAPSLELSGLQGKHHSLADHAGEVVIVNFWSTWCKPCKEEMPAMERMLNRLRERGVTLLAVAVGDSREAVERYQAAHRLGFPVLIDEGQDASEHWDVIAVPTTYVVDRNGRIALRVLGEYDWGAPDLIARIRALTRETTPSAARGERAKAPKNIPAG